jgi:hypothetical protein
MRLPTGCFYWAWTTPLFCGKTGFIRLRILWENPPKKYDFSKHPILSLSGKNGFRYGLPNYDDVINALSPPRDIRYCEWSKGQRGGVQRQCEWVRIHSETNARIRISTMRSPLIDAGIVGKTKTVDSTSVKFDPVHGLGMMNGLPKPYDVKGTKSV